MLTHIKWILIGVVLIGCIALFIWGDKIQPGSVFAGLAAFIAAIKSKLFGREKKPLDEISKIRKAHERERDVWEIEKRLYEERYDILKGKMDSLDRRIEGIRKEAGGRSEGEILDWLGKG